MIELKFACVVRGVGAEVRFRVTLRMPLFKWAEEEFVADMLKVMKPLFSEPNHAVVKQGEVGHGEYALVEQAGFQCCIQFISSENC